MSSEPKSTAKTPGRRIFSLVVMALVVLPAAVLGAHVAVVLNVPRLFIVALCILVSFIFSQKLEAWASAKLFPSQELEGPQGQSPPQSPDDGEGE